MSISSLLDGVGPVSARQDGDVVVARLHGTEVEVTSDAGLVRLHHRSALAWDEEPFPAAAQRTAFAVALARRTLTDATVTEDGRWVDVDAWLPGDADGLTVATAVRDVVATVGTLANALRQTGASLVPQRRAAADQPAASTDEPTDDVDEIEHVDDGDEVEHGSEVDEVAEPAPAGDEAPDTAVDETAAQADAPVTLTAAPDTDQADAPDEAAEDDEEPDAPASVGPADEVADEDASSPVEPDRPGEDDEETPGPARIASNGEVAVAPGGAPVGAVEPPSPDAEGIEPVASGAPEGDDGEDGGDVVVDRPDVDADADADADVDVDVDADADADTMVVMSADDAAAVDDAASPDVDDVPEDEEPAQHGEAPTTWGYVHQRVDVRGLTDPDEVVGQLEPGQWYAVMTTANGWAHVVSVDGSLEGWANDSLVLRHE